MKTVRDKTFELFRKLKIDTIFGNPGSTEETFLQNFPPDFKYIHTLQEASAVAAADAYAQATGTVGLVNVHTSAGLSNAMSGIISASMNKTPMIITAGNQTREMLLMEPWLSNINPEELPKPYIKWSYEPKRAEDVPEAMMRAYAMAIQEPAGPVFISIPLDDWNKEVKDELVVRTVAHRVGPDPQRIQEFANILSKANNPVLIYGADIAKFNGWDPAIALAEKIKVPVKIAPASERIPFPQNHPLYAGALPFAIKPLADELKGYDVALVIGAPVFRYYPYLPGEYLPAGLTLLHITNDPNEAARAPVGNSLISNPVLALEALINWVEPEPEKENMLFNTKTAKQIKTSDNGLSAFEVFEKMRTVMPDNTILVQETPSNMGILQKAWPTTFSEGYYTMASGSLGWGVPAAVGIALAEKYNGKHRPVVACIGDGSFQYAIQAIWTGRQHRLPIVYIVLINEEYGILKSFSECQNTPEVPGLDIPNLDYTSLAEGYGCRGKYASNLEEFGILCKEALQHNVPTIISIRITKDIPSLV